MKEYDEALKWYTEVLGLELRMDGAMEGSDMRFITVGVKGQEDVSIVLFKPFEGSGEAANPIHGLLFHTNDCRAEVERLKGLGVNVTMEPEEQPWGTQAVFEDLYGNSHVLLSPSQMAFERGEVRA